MPNYPVIELESVEFITLTVKVDGVAVTSNVDYMILAEGDRPSETSETWQATESLEGNIGFYTGDLTIGTWYVWVRVTDSPEIPVFIASKLKIV